MLPGDTVDHPGLGRVMVLTAPTLDPKRWRVVVNGSRTRVETYAAFVFDALRDGGRVRDVEVSCG